MSEIVIPIAFWTIILFPIGVFVWQMRRMRRGNLSLGKTTARFFLVSIVPVVLYALVFFLAAVIEEISGAAVVGEGYARSLLLVLAIGSVWTLLVAITFAVLGMLINRKRT